MRTLSKPFDTRSLIDKVSTLVKGRARPPVPAPAQAAAPAPVAKPASEPVAAKARCYGSAGDRAAGDDDGYGAECSCPGASSLTGRRCASRQHP